MNTENFWVAISALATLVYTTVTAINLVFVSRQITDSRRFMQAQFINELQREFHQFSKVFEQLEQPEQLKYLDNNHLEMRNAFIECFNFFERIKTLLDTNVINLHLINRVFAYQFFLLVNTPQVQDKILFERGNHFWEIFALHKQLIDFRNSRGQFIPLAKTDLARRNPSFYQANLKHYHQNIKRNSGA
ncbi:MAG: hypothetical protein PUP91_01100 [Rhizonema sp. PD37]|nr:hypothetical protein [Rhizonema sp. PD37]